MSVRVSYLLGLDRGQAQDPSALAVLERTEERAGPAYYGCRALKRWPLGMSYPAIVEDVARILRQPTLAGAELAIDQTGVGRPVCDLFRRANLPAKVRPVTITAGLQQSYHQGDGYHVAKVILISGVQVLLQSRRLQFSEKLPETPTLVRELENYRVKVTVAANETFSPRGESDHDDLLLALSLAVWLGERPRPTAGALDLGAGAAGETRWEREQRRFAERQAAYEREQRWLAQGGTDGNGTEEWRAFMRRIGRR